MDIRAHDIDHCSSHEHMASINWQYFVLFYICKEKSVSSFLFKYLEKEEVKWDIGVPSQTSANNCIQWAQSKFWVT